MLEENEIACLKMNLENCDSVNKDLTSEIIRRTIKVDGIKKKNRIFEEKLEKVFQSKLKSVAQLYADINAIESDCDELEARVECAQKSEESLLRQNIKALQHSKSNLDEMLRDLSHGEELLADEFCERMENIGKMFMDNLSNHEIEDVDTSETATEQNIKYYEDKIIKQSMQLEGLVKFGCNLNNSDDIRSGSMLDSLRISTLNLNRAGESFAEAERHLEILKMERDKLKARFEELKTELKGLEEALK